MDTKKVTFGWDDAHRLNQLKKRFIDEGKLDGEDSEEASRLSLRWTDAMAAISRGDGSDEWVNREAVAACLYRWDTL